MKMTKIMLSKLLLSFFISLSLQTSCMDIIFSPDGKKSLKILFPIELTEKTITFLDLRTRSNFIRTCSLYHGTFNNKRAMFQNLNPHDYAISMVHYATNNTTLIQSLIYQEGEINHADRLATLQFFHIPPSHNKILEYSIATYRGLFLHDGSLPKTLYNAVFNNNIPATYLCLTLGANVNAKSDLPDQWAPLHCAVALNNGPMVTALLACDTIDVNLKTESAQTAIDLATERNFPEIIALLKAHKKNSCSMLVEK